MSHFDLYTANKIAAKSQTLKDKTAILAIATLAEDSEHESADTAAGKLADLFTQIDRRDRADDLALENGAAEDLLKMVRPLLADDIRREHRELIELVGEPLGDAVAPEVARAAINEKVAELKSMDQKIAEAVVKGYFRSGAAPAEPNVQQQVAWLDRIAAKLSSDETGEHTEAILAGLERCTSAAMRGPARDALLARLKSRIAEMSGTTPPLADSRKAGFDAMRKLCIDNNCDVLTIRIDALEAGVKDAEALPQHSVVRGELCDRLDEDAKQFAGSIQLAAERGQIADLDAIKLQEYVGELRKLLRLLGVVDATASRKAAKVKPTVAKQPAKPIAKPASKPAKPAAKAARKTR